MKIPIVDENDNRIKLVEREEMISGDVNRGAAVWITDEEGNILLQKRRLDKLYSPGKWQPAAGGTLEEGETYESNAYKELEEETGIKGIKLVELKKVYVEEYKMFVDLFQGKISKDYKLLPQESEVEQLKWFTKEELFSAVRENPEAFTRDMKEIIDIFI